MTIDKEVKRIKDDGMAKAFVSIVCEAFPDEFQEAAGKLCRRQDNNGWISVKDRLPEDERKVLVYYGFDDGNGISDIRSMGLLTYFAFDPQPHFQHASSGLKVTHWQPLPEPPEEDNNN